jgi:hypothetical protein
MTIWVLLLTSGVRVPTATLLVAVAAAQSASGAVWWRMIRRPHAMPFAELIGMGIALGTFASLVSAQLLRTSPLGRWGLLVPAVITAEMVAVQTIRRPARREPLLDDAGRSGIELIPAVVLGLLVFIPFWMTEPLRLRGEQAHHPDIAFHEALARSIATFGPGDSVFAVGRPIRYHWFTSAWAGSTQQVVGAPSFVVITRLVPLVALIASAALAWTLARRCSQVRWVPPLAAVLVAGSSGLIPYLEHLLPLSPAQAFATPWLLALSIVALDLAAGRTAPHRALPVLFVLGVACMGGRINHAGVAVCGLGVLCLSTLRSDRETRRRVFGGALAAGAGMAVAFVVVIAGGSGNGFGVGSGLTSAARAWRLLPAGGWLGVALGSVAYLAGMLSRWVGFACLLLDTEHRRRPETAYGAGVALGGLVGLVATIQSGQSQILFAVSASTVLSCLSAVGIGVAFACLPTQGVDPGRSQTRHLLRSAALLGVLVGPIVGFVYWGMWIYSRFSIRAGLDGSEITAWLTGGIPRFLAPLVVWGLAVVAAISAFSNVGRAEGRRFAGLILTVVITTATVTTMVATAVFTLARPGGPKGDWTYAWGESREAAASWLADASPPEDVIAVNRFCDDPFLEPPKCGSRWFVVSSLTGRRTLLEGYDYGVGVGGLPEWAVERVVLSTRFATRPTPRDAQRLWEFGVRWVWVDREINDRSDWEPMAEVAFRNDTTVILALRAPAS